jgi:hypothetical protein
LDGSSDPLPGGDAAGRGAFAVPNAALRSKPGVRSRPRAVESLESNSSEPITTDSAHRNPEPVATLDHVRLRITLKQKDADLNDFNCPAADERVAEPCNPPIHESIKGKDNTLTSSAKWKFRRTKECEQLAKFSNHTSTNDARVAPMSS